MNRKSKFTAFINGVIIIVFMLSLAGCVSSSNNNITSERILLGNEQFDLYIPLLTGKRVALYSNHTGIVGDKIFHADGSQADITNGNPDIDASLIPFSKDSEGNDIIYGEDILDALIERNVNVTAIFCPEHGFRCTEDTDTIDDSVDKKTGIPILSLYVNYTFSIVVDMQDVLPNGRMCNSRKECNHPRQA